MSYDVYTINVLIIHNVIYIYATRGISTGSTDIRALKTLRDKIFLQSRLAKVDFCLFFGLCKLPPEI